MPATLSRARSLISTTLLGSAPPGLRAELLLQHGHETRVAVAQRVDEPVPVVGVDVGGGVRATDRGHGPDMVDVAVRQQHRCWPEAVGRQHLPEGLLDPDPGIDDDALLTRGRREHVAVRVKREGGERDGQHAGSLTAPSEPAQRHTAIVACCEKVESSRTRDPMSTTSRTTVPKMTERPG